MRFGVQFGPFFAVTEGHRKRRWGLLTWAVFSIFLLAGGGLISAAVTQWALYSVAGLVVLGLFARCLRPRPAGPARTRHAGRR